MSLFDAIGFVGTILTTIGFAQSNLPGSAPSGAVIRVKVGLEDNSGQNFGGRLAKITGYDANNAIIGSAVPQNDISSGDFADYTLDQNVDGVQTQFASFIGTNGAICISWLTLKNKDGAADAAWTGDVGFNCGHSWNWGNQVAGRTKDTNEPFKPRCTWLDADNTNSIDTAGMKIDFFAYGEQLQDTLSNNAACSKTIFSGNTGEIDGVPNKKRSMVGVERPEWMNKRLIVSEFPTDNATELCQHNMSYGPDAVGSDGYYCNMATRELLPLCSFQNVEGCVDVDTENKHVRKRTYVAKRSVDLHYRSYEKLDTYIDA
ncbi:hypothetical protein GQ43DRAFT_458389 [Delitschia confertaspora ATCC 74209]|uniref:Uncharacterized protein n=1 Tax=Delitschia confertaspora ATCC 74209 TaxID=1513339 RepID=A0A9P4MP56_9PLEO|nr:hypothetical protein GQ43DRAFT_458389 [Delitschia confertaspora ATCC 74209]